MFNIKITADNIMKIGKSTVIKLILAAIILIILVIGAYYLNPIKAIIPEKSVIHDTMLGNTDYGNVVKEGPYG